MQIGANSAVDSVARLLQVEPTGQNAVQTAVLRKAMDTAASQSLNLIQSLLPNLGHKVDARV